MKIKSRKLITAFAVTGLSVAALSGCGILGGTSEDNTETSNVAYIAATSESADASDVALVSHMEAEESESKAYSGEIPEGFTERDFDGSVSNAVTVKLATDGTEAGEEGVTVEGNTVTFTKGGTYVLTGELEQGQIVVDLPGENDKVQLVLDGVNITSSGSAGLYVKNADKVFVTLAEGSENSISSVGEFVQTDDNNVDGAIYSKDDIVFNGDGSLEVSCESGHGIVSKNDLKITGGDIRVASGSKALQGKDMVGIAGGSIVLDAGTDGIDSVDVAVYDGDLDISAGDEGISSDVTDENTEPKVTLAGGKINISSGDDGIQTTGDVAVEGTDLTIVAGGGSACAAEHYDDMQFGGMGGWQGMGSPGPQFGGEQSSSGEINFDTDDDESTDEGSKNKGIKAKNITFTSGTVNVDSQDDAIHADGDITVEGGSFEIMAGDDGLHADSKLTVNGGTFTITAWEGLEATVVVINDGDIFISASDDGINAVQKVSGLTPSIEINGGKLYIKMASGDTDALDSNGGLYITGGTVEIEAQFAFDFDGEGALSGGTVTVNGEQVTEITNSMMVGPGGMQGGMGVPNGMQGGMIR